MWDKKKKIGGVFFFLNNFFRNSLRSSDELFLKKKKLKIKIKKVLNVVLIAQWGLGPRPTWCFKVASMTMTMRGLVWNNFGCQKKWDFILVARV